MESASSSSHRASSVTSSSSSNADPQPPLSPSRYGIEDFKAYGQSLHGQMSNPLFLKGAARLKLLDLVSTLTGHVAHQREPEIADDLLECIHDATVDLRRLNPAWIASAYALPEATWAMLDRLVPGGIHTVQMPPAASAGDLPVLARALSGLKDLRQLDLPVPRAGERLDLSGLRLGYPDSFHLHLAATRNADWLVKVPQHSHVHAERGDAVAFDPNRSLVVYADAAGALTGEYHPLGDTVRFRTPPTLLEHKQSRDGHPAATGWGHRAINTNGRAFFQDDAEGPIDVRDNRIVCRHITIWVLEQWRRLEADATQARAPQQAYERLATPDSVREHVRPWTERAYLKTWTQRPAALFTSAGFGAALRSQFDQMTAGAYRRFMVCTTDHAVALQLHVRPLGNPGRPVKDRFMITAFDPNTTVMDRSLALPAPADFEGVRFSEWAWANWDDKDRAGDPSLEPVIALWEYPGIDGAATPRRAQDVEIHGITEDDLRSPGLLHTLLCSGVAALVPRWVNAVVRNWEAASLPLAGMMACYLRDWTSHAAGVCRHRSDEMEALLGSLMAIDPARLDRRHLPLAMNPVGNRRNPNRTVLDWALDWHPWYLGLYARTVMGPAGRHLDPATRLALMQHTGCETGTWLAHVVQTLDAQEPADRQAQRIQALQEMLQAILGARHLPVQERVGVLNGSGRKGEAWLTPFTQALARGQALPAAILLCHLHEQGTEGIRKPGDLQELSVEGVLTALYRTGSAPALAWADRLAAHRDRAEAAVLAKGPLQRLGVSFRPLTVAEVVRDPLRAAALLRDLGWSVTDHQMAHLDPRGLNGAPLLHALVEAAAMVSPASPLVTDAIYHLVHELAWRRSGVTTVLPEALGFTSHYGRFPGGLGTAGHAALRVDPRTEEPVARDAAAAMVCAVLDATLGSDPPGARHWVVERMLVDLGLADRLKDVLGPRPAGWPDGRPHWSERVLVAASRADAPPGVAEQLKRRAMESQMGFKWPKDDAAALEALRRNLRNAGRLQWRGDSVTRAMAALMRRMEVVGHDINPALVVCCARKAPEPEVDPLRLWRVRGTSRLAAIRRDERDGVYLLPLDGFKPVAREPLFSLAQSEAAQFETKAQRSLPGPAQPSRKGPIVVHAAPARSRIPVLSAAAVTLAGAGESLRKACLDARLHAVGNDPSRAGHVLCVADAAIGALVKFEVDTPADAKSSQAKGVFYSIPATLLEAVQAGR